MTSFRDVILPAFSRPFNKTHVVAPAVCVTRDVAKGLVAELRQRFPEAMVQIHKRIIRAGNYGITVFVVTTTAPRKRRSVQAMEDSEKFAPPPMKEGS